MACADSSRLDVRAPKLLTRAFVVSNHSGIERRLEDLVELPDGWQLITGDSSFVIPPSGSELRLLCISVPVQAAPGEYLLTYRVVDHQQSTAALLQTFRVNVLPVIKLEVASRDAPKRITAGGEYSVQFQVTNRSNTSCDVTLEARSTAGLPVHLNLTEWTAEPGESHLVTATIKSSASLKQAMTNRLVFKARAHNGQDSVVEANSASMVEILPRTTFSEDLYRRVPSVLGIHVLADRNVQAAQVEYTGAGAIDSKGQYRINYLARGPSDLQRNVYGMQDEYSIGLEHRLGDARVGDQNFTLTPLMEQGRYGRGAKLAMNQGHFTAGAYSFSSRPHYTPLKETALYVGYAPNARYGFRLNYLGKSTDRMAHTNLMSASCNAIPLRGTNLEVEVSSGMKSNVHLLQQSAFLGRFTGQFDGIHVSLEKVTAGQAYAGYYRDQDSNLGSVFLPLAEKLQGHLTYRTMLQNLSQDPTRGAALRERQFQMGGSYSFPFRSTVTLDFDQLRRTDLVNLTKPDYDENSATVRVRHSIKLFSLSGSLKKGNWTDQRTGRKGQLDRYGTSLSWCPNPSQNYSGSLQSGTDGSYGEPRRITSASMSASYNHLQKWDVTVSFQKSGFLKGSDVSEDQFSVDGHWHVWKDHTASIRVRKLSNSLARRYAEGTSAVIGYEIPLGMPVSRQADFGRVKGQVFDAEETTHKGIPNVALMLDGITTLTDKDGNFVFPTLKPGVHYLQIDRSTIGMNRITTRRMPMEINVRGGKTENVRIGISRGGSLFLQAAVYGLDENRSARGIIVEQDSLNLAAKTPQDLEKKYSLSGLDLELKDDQESLHAVTDRNGTVSAEGLRPGHWTVVVSNANLPAFHDLERTVYEFDVQPESQQDLAVRILPRTRPVIIVDEGKVPIISADRKQKK